MPSLNRSTPRHNDRGVSALVFALALPMIIGAVGLSVDGGRMAIERVNLQNASDSAARAVGQDCARASRVPPKDPARCTNSGAGSTIALAINGTSPGATGAVEGTLAAASGSTKVNLSKTVPMTLGATIGIKPKNLTATTTVRWDETPIAGPTYPVSLDICSYSDWAASSAVQKKTPKLYRYDYQPNEGTSHTRPGNCPDNAGGSHRSIGKALWVVQSPHSGSEFDSGKCLISSSAGAKLPGDKIMPNNPNFPDSCVTAANKLIVNTTYLMMISESSGWDGFGNAEPPKILGYAPFLLTGWRHGSDKNNGPLSISSPAPASCTSECRGLEGYFTSSITQLPGAESYGVNPNADFGAVRVKITK